MAKCFLCEKENIDTKITHDGDRPIYKVNCSNCGEYSITDILLKTVTTEGKLAVAWFIKNNPSELITTENINYIIQEYRIYLQSMK